MIPRSSFAIFLAIASVMAFVVDRPAEAQYRYGGRYRSAGTQGFFVLVEAMSANPRNTDLVIATAEGQSFVVPIIPDWHDEAAYRIGVGYRWASGNKVSVSVWNFETDQQASGSAPRNGFLDFAIGPFVYSGGGYIGATGAPGTYDIQTDLSAQTADLWWAREHPFTEAFTMEWGAGLRYALYEERSTGNYGEPSGYDPGSGPVLVDKRNEGEMLGIALGVRGTYRFSRQFSLSGKLAFSMLDGELNAQATSTPTGLVGGSPVLPVTATLTDDSRSGTIRDLDLVLAWHLRNDKYRVFLGWEQSTWDAISSDLMRNLPGTTVQLRDRNSVVFSGWKIGFAGRF